LGEELGQEAVAAADVEEATTVAGGVEERKKKHVGRIWRMLQCVNARHRRN
jgi:hypothetical protein